MNIVASSRYFCKLSILLIIAMILPLIAPAAYGDTNGTKSPILISDTPGQLAISVGKEDRIEVGTQGIISRDDTKIADYEVKKVEWGYSIISVSNSVQGETIKVGDKAPITNIPANSGQKVSKRGSSSKVLWTLLAIGAVAALACGHGGGGDGGTPSNQGGSNDDKSSIILSSTSASIPADGASSATITATIKGTDSKAAADGTVVTFSSTSGSITPTATTTGGIATAILTSNTTPGNVTVTATSGSTSKTMNVAFVSVPYSVIVECNPSSIQCDGNAFATVKATVRDIAGNLVTDGTVVNFSIQADANGGGNGTITPSLQTTNGIATATLFSKDSTGTTSKAGTATIVAIVPSTGQPVGVPSPITDINNHTTQAQFISLDVKDITLGSFTYSDKAPVAAPYAISRLAGSPVGYVRAVVRDNNNNPVADGTVVYFTTNRGMIYGASGSASAVATCYTSNGIADAELISDGTSGPVNVTATCGNVTNAGNMFTLN